MAERMLKFVATPQALPDKRAAAERRRDFDEIYASYARDRAAEQASRCSQCGVPFCQVHCPLNNNIPDWLKLTAEGRLEEAYAHHAARIRAAARVIDDDLRSLAVGASGEALLLGPQGKVDAWVRCTRTGPETFVLDTEAGWGSAVIARLERFKLRTRCTVRPLDWACLSLRTTTPGGPAGLTAPAGGTGGPVVAIEVDWPGWSGLVWRTSSRGK